MDPRGQSAQDTGAMEQHYEWWFVCGAWYSMKYLRVMTHRVPVRYEDSRDPLKATRLQALSEALMPDAFDDAKRLAAEFVMQKISPQLYASVVSIDANIGE